MFCKETLTDEKLDYLAESYQKIKKYYNKYISLLPFEQFVERNLQVYYSLNVYNTIIWLNANEKPTIESMRKKLLYD